MKNTKKLIVAMSGGVDSSVTAYLLKRQGYNIHGVYMKNWDESDENGVNVCPTTQDWLDVQKVCKQLDIPCTKVEFIKEYWNNVFTEMLDTYKKGFTPNPDVLCNKFIKFDALIKYCENKFDTDFIATGHYAQRGEGYSLLRAKDTFKDQSYFLSFVNQKQFQKILFPIGHLVKSEVREIARQQDLCVASKKDSVGICFIGKRNFQSFLCKF